MHPRICKLAIPSKTAIDNPWYFCFDADNCFMTWKLEIIAIVIKLFYSFYERINNPFLRTLWTYTNLSFVGLYSGFKYKKFENHNELQYNYLMHKWYSKDLRIYLVILYLSVWMSPKKVELQTLSLQLLAIKTTKIANYRQ